MNLQYGIDSRSAGRAVILAFIGCAVFSSVPRADAADSETSEAQGTAIPSVTNSGGTFPNQLTKIIVTATRPPEQVRTIPATLPPLPVQPLSRRSPQHIRFIA